MFNQESSPENRVLHLQEKRGPWCIRKAKLRRQGLREKYRPRFLRCLTRLPSHFFADLIL
jgi:hypothetical protein